MPDQKPQVGSQPQAGSAHGESQQPLCFLPNNFDNRPGRLIPQPLSQHDGASQPQAGAATSQPQAGSAPQAGSTQQAGASQHDDAQLRLANKRASKPGFLQQGAASQHEGATSQPQAGASQPQAGSTAQPESHPLLHNFPNRPADAFAEVKAAKARASITGVITRRIVVGSKGLGI